MLTLISRKTFKTMGYKDVEKAFLFGVVPINARRPTWPPNHWAYYDGDRLWRFDGIHKASLTLTDIDAKDWEVSAVTPFVHPDSFHHLLDHRHAIVM